MSMRTIVGRAFVYGDQIDTDVLAPGAYMKRPIRELAQHCLEAIDPTFASTVSRGDVVVAGTGFGIGSSREQAAQALVELGVGCVLAKSFARIFYRNALNLGLPVLVLPPDAHIVHRGERIEIEPGLGLVRLPDRELTISAEPIPEFLQALLVDGGLIPHLKKRLANRS
jgi:3-isopropylmalate dehydratase small subunit